MYGAVIFPQFIVCLLFVGFYYTYVALIESGFSVSAQVRISIYIFRYERIDFCTSSSFLHFSPWSPEVADTSCHPSKDWLVSLMPLRCLGWSWVLVGLLSTQEEAGAHPSLQASCPPGIPWNPCLVPSGLTLLHRHLWDCSLLCASGPWSAQGSFCHPQWHRCPSAWYTTWPFLTGLVPGNQARPLSQGPSSITVHLMTHPTSALLPSLGTLVGEMGKPRYSASGSSANLVLYLTFL